MSIEERKREFCFVFFTVSALSKNPSALASQSAWSTGGHQAHRQLTQGLPCGLHHCTWVNSCLTTVAELHIKFLLLVIFPCDCGGFWETFFSETNVLLSPNLSFSSYRKNISSPFFQYRNLIWRIPFSQHQRFWKKHFLSCFFGTSLNCAFTLWMNFKMWVVTLREGGR